MDPKIQLINEKFDVRKSKEKCNVIDCESEPEMIVSIIEMKAKGILRKRGLVDLFLCKKHAKGVGILIRNLNKFADKGIVITVEESKLEPPKARYVTF